MPNSVLFLLVLLMITTVFALPLGLQDDVQDNGTYKQFFLTKSVITGMGVIFSKDHFYSYYSVFHFKIPS